MPFNPFTWNTTQPSASQLISDGQVTILNNFNFLANTNGNATNGFVQFPSGLIMQWGKTGDNLAGQNNYTFAGATGGGGPVGGGCNMQAFPNACFCVFISTLNGGTAHVQGSVLSGSVTPTGFTLNVKSGETSNSGSYVFAIGN